MTLYNINKRVVMGPWANSRKLAVILGCVDFYTGVICLNGHDTIRRTASGKCYECERMSWEKVRRRKGKKIFEPNAARQAAEMLKEKYFYGAVCPHGHTAGLRWTHNGACVDCTVLSSREFMKTPEGKKTATLWRIANIDKVHENNRNMKAKRRGAEGTHTAKDISDLLTKQKFKCAECGVSVKKRKSRHVDHVMPLALGGSNWPSNIQILCVACNLSKNARHPLDWARIRGRLL